MVIVVKRQKAALRCQILVSHELWGTKKVLTWVKQGAKL